jgi:hypothetical protein
LSDRKPDRLSSYSSTAHDSGKTDPGDAGGMSVLGHARNKGRALRFLRMKKEEK